MLTINVDTSGEEYMGAYFECPLRTDLNCCAAIRRSEINHCPQTIDDAGNMQAIPPIECPLRDGGVTIQFKEEENTDATTNLVQENLDGEDPGMDDLR